MAVTDGRPAPDLPTGTNTFLFTDVVGSTPLWDAHPDHMAAALERHEVIVKAAIVDHGGHVFSTAGDSFAAVFASACRGGGAAR